MRSYYEPNKAAAADGSDGYVGATESTTRVAFLDNNLPAATTVATATFQAGCAAVGMEYGETASGDAETCAGKVSIAPYCEWRRGRRFICERMLVCRVEFPTLAVPGLSLYYLSHVALFVATADALRSSQPEEHPHGSF